jgi:hypothetical protein
MYCMYVYADSCTVCMCMWVHSCTSVEETVCMCMWVHVLHVCMCGFIHVPGDGCFLKMYCMYVYVGSFMYQCGGLFKNVFKNGCKGCWFAQKDNLVYMCMGVCALCVCVCVCVCVRACVCLCVLWFHLLLDLEEMFMHMHIHMYANIDIVCTCMYTYKYIHTYRRRSRQG